MDTAKNIVNEWINFMRDEEYWTDEQWPVFKKARDDGYRAWNGKGHVLNGNHPGDAAYDIVKQAVEEQACDKADEAQNGYYIGTVRGLRGEPLEGIQKEEGKP